MMLIVLSLNLVSYSKAEVFIDAKEDSLPYDSEKYTNTPYIESIKDFFHQNKKLISEVHLQHEIYTPDISSNSYLTSTSVDNLSFDPLKFPIHYNGLPMHLLEEDSNWFTRILEITYFVNNFLEIEETEELKNTTIPQLLKELMEGIDHEVQNKEGNPGRPLRLVTHIKNPELRKKYKLLFNEFKLLASKFVRKSASYALSKPFKRELNEDSLKRAPKIGPMSTKYCMTECHEMKNPASEYLYSQHYTNYKDKYGAGCGNCHIYPESFEVKHSYNKKFAIGAIPDKLRAVSKEVLGHLLNDFPDAETFDKHREEMAHSVKTKIKMEEAFSCRQCHYIPSLAKNLTENKDYNSNSDSDSSDHSYKENNHEKENESFNNHNQQQQIALFVPGNTKRMFESSKEHYQETQEKIKEKNPGAEMSLHKQSLFAMKMHDFSRHNNIHSCTDCHLGVAHQVKSKYFDKIASHIGPVTVISNLNYPKDKSKIIKNPKDPGELKFKLIEVEYHHDEDH